MECIIVIIKGLYPVNTMQNRYQNADLKGSLNKSLRIMMCTGYWFPRNINKNSKFLCGLYTFLVVGMTLATVVVTEAAYLILVARDLEDLIDASFIMLTHLVQFVKVCYVIEGRERIYCLLDIMDEKLFKARNARQLKNSMKIIKSTNRIFYILVAAVTFTCCFFYAIPLMENKNGYQLPVKAVYPFNIAVNYYKSVYMYQSFVYLFCSFGNVALDMTAATSMSQISIQLGILNDTIIHIKEFAELQFNEKKGLQQTKSKNVRGDSQTIPAGLQYEMNTLLVECVKHHLKVLR